MKSRTRSLTVLVVLVALGANAFQARAAQPGQRVRFSLVLYPIANQATEWDGTISVRPGRVAEVQIARPTARNAVEGASWKTSTAFGNARISRGMRQKLAKGEKLGGRLLRPLENQVLVTLADVRPDSTVQVSTKNGDLSFMVRDVPYGAQKRAIRGRLQVLRVPVSTVIVSAPTEDDFPAAAAGPDGTVYVAYTAYTHGKSFSRRLPVPEPMEDFSVFAEPVGGDQVLVVSGRNGEWSKPQAVTPGGEDLFGVAVAVDGQGRTWVFWGANVDGNWDLFARALRAGTWSPPVRLTRHAGADLYPVAATDAQGNVWLAWMGFRGETADILALRQAGDGFGEPLVVSEAAGNQWDPAIATSRTGDVAVAWDTYQKGDYDVYCRVWRQGKLGPAVAVSASLRHEARPTVAYDGSGRLWIAYEDSPEGWGKDFGPYDQEGTRLYNNPNRAIAVKVLADGKLARPVQDIMERFSYTPKGKQKVQWNPLAAPVVSVDSAGRVWVGVRSKRGSRFSGVGTVWFEELTSYSGNEWSDPFPLLSSDGLLDRRPAFVSLPDGTMVLVGPTDGREVQAFIPNPRIARMLKAQGHEMPQRPKPKWADPVNSEIAAHEFGVPVGTVPEPELEALPPGAPASPADLTLREIEDVKRLRTYRTTLGGKQLRIARGEFHRHTEISGDGGGDGTLQDMWRYGIDAAGMDWIGNGDHDNGGNRDYPWWITQKTTDVFNNPPHFVPMFTYERSMVYPDGHRNAMFAKRGIRTLPRLQGGLGKIMDDQPEDVAPPHSPDVQQFFRYLRAFDGVCASHTSATDMGTDWRDWGGEVEPFVEIYQGDRQNYERPGAPRANTAEYSIGGWRPRGFVNKALKKGYRLAFQASSDHISTHMSYCNLYVEELTREAMLEAAKKRRVYGSTDNIIADVRCQGHFMGEEFETDQHPTIEIKLVGSQPFDKVWIVRNDEYVYSKSPGTQDVELAWTDTSPPKGETSYYYVRGEQTDEEIVWVSPMWIKYTGE